MRAGLGAARRSARRANSLCLIQAPLTIRGWGRSPHRQFVVWDDEGSRSLRLDVVDELAFGRHREALAENHLGSEPIGRPAWSTSSRFGGIAGSVAMMVAVVATVLLVSSVVFGTIVASLAAAVAAGAACWSWFFLPLVTFRRDD